MFKILGMDIQTKIQKFIDNFLDQNQLIAKIIAQIHLSGGTAVLVGGAVRDLFLDQQTKDFDIETYGLAPEQLQLILLKFGPVQEIGKSFGVYLLPGVNVDWSLPRTDSAGRKPDVKIEPNLTVNQAFRRRDLTINALGISFRTRELIDPFNGLHDLQSKTLRYIDRDLFVQDPLRFYRVMQLIGRLQMQPDQALNDLCNRMDLRAVSRERIETEFNKLFLKSNSPSLGIRWLQQIGRLHAILPELYSTIGVSQDPVWHPEGDVFEHTMQALDCAARQDYSDMTEKLLIMYASLVHDLGKVSTTKLIEHKWRSINHAPAGVVIAKKLLMRITGNQKLIKYASILVRYHMEPLQFINNRAGLIAYKKLALKLMPLSIALLVKLSLVDRAGRKLVGINLPTKIWLQDDVDLQYFVNQAKLAGVYYQAEPPILQGRDLLDVVKPGPVLGKLLAQAYLIQLQEGVFDKSILKKRVLKLKNC